MDKTAAGRVQEPALRTLRVYQAQKRAGLTPTFDPVKLGIRNADLWCRESPTL